MNSGSYASRITYLKRRGNRHGRNDTGELAKRTGLSMATIRYYEDSGILPSPSGLQRCVPFRNCLPDCFRRQMKRFTDKE
ncbi:MerR family DNA-binding transcriptional regulator [Paenibacillus sp. 22594]|uniref:MerR family DNA-binding transcriptional regulator n=1 Tax=Paenibacillus sp. 22594 TaxID=3453947 RepID=UPI003F83C6AC